MKLFCYSRKSTRRGHSKSVYTLKGEGVPMKAYENTQVGGGLFKESAYAHVFFTL